MIRRISLISILIAAVTLISGIPSQAYTMADYWALNEGNAWVYDRDFRVVGSETHNFANYTGRQFLQASDFYDTHAYIYSGPAGLLVVGMFDYETQQFIDISGTPIKLSNAEMNLGDSVTNNFPAGVIDESAITITITLEAFETVTVPAGTFDNALRARVVINDGVGTYTERVWMAKGVGMVQIYRVSETNNTPGCFMTCSSFNPCNSNVVEQRYTKLKSFIRGTNRVVVIPLLGN